MGRWTQRLIFLLDMGRGARQRSLARVRPHLGRNEFVALMAKTGADSVVASLIWDELTPYVIVDSFTPYPEDHLYEIFGITDEELEIDLIAAICEATGRELPTQELVDAIFVDDKVQTVAALITRCPAKVPNA